MMTIGDVLNYKMRDKRHIGTTDGQFSVCQFFVSGEHEYVRRWVGVEEAVQAFEHYTNNVAVRLGFVTRVVITDAMDCTAAEWVHDGDGKGHVIDYLEPEKDEEDNKPITEHYGVMQQEDGIWRAQDIELLRCKGHGFLTRDEAVAYCFYLEEENWGE